MTEADQLDLAISQLMRILIVDERRLFSDLGAATYNPLDVETLTYLWRQPGSTAKEIGLFLGVQATTMQSAIDRLQRRELLQRDHTALKGRSVALILTEAGETFCRRMHTHNLQNCEQMLSALAKADRPGFVRNIAAIAAKMAT
ncbi:winged helix DNA-binding protein [Novosphingobium sp.]|uniref:MarR family winged helix-turn-helix transcriptional regulator n=1 Tax=Novosphingobium sp. TaxID=1874826 RepID=UPI00286ACDC0|nr:winged helix DNA-binding protein [Novosphingobium sp.]